MGARPADPPLATSQPSFERPSPSVERDGRLIAHRERQDDGLNEFTGLDGTLQCPELAGHVVLPLIAHQVDGGHDIELARTHELEMQVRDPLDLPMTDDALAHYESGVVAGGRANEVPVVAVDQNDGYETEEDPDEQGSNGVEGGVAG